MTFVKTIRRETGLIEHICKHGIGHPAYASADWIARTSCTEDSEFSEVRDAWMIHGCDGCCNSAEWQLESLRNSVEIANQIIIEHKEYLELMKENHA